VGLDRNVYSSVFNQVSAKTPKLPGTKFATTVLCRCSNIDTWIIAWGSMSNANICGSFRCSWTKVEKHWSTGGGVTGGLYQGGQNLAVGGPLANTQKKS